MCGIAGIWGDGDIKRMTEILRHRGPDDYGYYEGDRVKLGVRRLSVIDLTTGHQPISNEDESAWIVLNGEIFNYKEIKKGLKGHQFKTKTDTEVILHAYEEYGPACLDLFNGMFALAIWDGEKLFVARDRMGEKPLYYAFRDGRFFFASEIKSIITQIEAIPNLTEEFFAFETPVGEGTLFKDIFQLLPGHYLTFDGEKLQIKKYWEIKFDQRRALDENDLAEELRWLITDSVRLRLISDVPLGVYLSGGIDSSIIACLAKPEKVFTCHYPYGEKYDEYHYAELLAKHIGAEQITIRPSADDFLENYPKVMWHLDQPVASASSISEMLLARCARDHVKVVLGGQGADELFGGYTRYLLMLAEEELANWDLIKNYQPLAKFFWGDKMFSDRDQRYFDLVKRCTDAPQGPFALFKGFFAKPNNLLDSMCFCDINISLPSLLTMNDRGAASFGLENRTPFLDHRIVEFAFSLPPQLKVKEYQTKYILRRASRGIVPDEIINRRDKKGLVVPYQHWFAGPLRDWAAGLAESLSGRTGWPEHISRGEFDRALYSQVSLELWFRNFIDKPVEYEAFI